MQLFNVKSITDSELYSRIDRFCDILCHPIDHLNEMAYEKKEIMNRLANETLNIFENWTLVKYTTLHGNVYQCRLHWSAEFIAACGKIQLMKLTKGNNRDSVYKALAEVWYKKAEYNGEDGIETIMGLIHPKFIKENLMPTNYNRQGYDMTLRPLATALYNELDNILRLIAYEDSYAIREYIESV